MKKLLILILFFINCLAGAQTPYWQTLRGPILQTYKQTGYSANDSLKFTFSGTHFDLTPSNSLYSGLYLNSYLSVKPNYTTSHMELNGSYFQAIAPTLSFTAEGGSTTGRTALLISGGKNYLVLDSLGFELNDNSANGFLFSDYFYFHHNSYISLNVGIGGTSNAGFLLRPNTYWLTCGENRTSDITGDSTGLISFIAKGNNDTATYYLDHNGLRAKTNYGARYGEYSMITKHDLDSLNSLINDSISDLHLRTAVAQNIKSSDTSRWASVATYTASNGLTMTGNDVQLGGDALYTEVNSIDNDALWFGADAKRWGSVGFRTKTGADSLEMQMNGQYMYFNNLDTSHHTGTSVVTFDKMKQEILGNSFGYSKTLTNDVSWQSDVSGARSIGFGDYVGLNNFYAQGAGTYNPYINFNSNLGLASLGNDSVSLGIGLNGSFVDNRKNPTGVGYAANYHRHLGNLSWVDKSYVDSISGENDTVRNISLLNYVDAPPTPYYYPGIYSKQVNSGSGYYNDLIITNHIDSIRMSILTGGITLKWSSKTTTLNSDLSTNRGIFLDTTRTEKALHVKGPIKQTISGVTKFKIDDNGYIYNDVPHAVSIFMDSTVTITLSQNTWYQVTRQTAKTTWPTTEYVGFTESGDSIIIPYNGDYEAKWQVNLTGVNAKDYEYRIMRRRSAANTEVWRYGITSAGLKVLRPFESYISDAQTNDRYWIELRSTSSAPGNVTLHSGNLIFKTIHLDN